MGGIVGLSGAHCTEIDWGKEVNIGLKKETKMFLYHGRSDPMISVTIARKSYEEFKDHGLDYSLEEESGLAHSLSIGEL